MNAASGVTDTDPPVVELAVAGCRNRLVTHPGTQQLQCGEDKHLSCCLSQEQNICHCRVPKVLLTNECSGNDGLII